MREKENKRASTHVHASTSTPLPNPPVAGGYKPVANAANDAEVQEAATFAVGAIDPTLRLVNVTAAATQVVAGLNYKLTLTAAPANGTAGGGGGTYDVVVYRPLGADAKLQLTSSKKVDG